MAGPVDLVFNILVKGDAAGAFLRVGQAAEESAKLISDADRRIIASAEKTSTELRAIQTRGVASTRSSDAEVVASADRRMVELQKIGVRTAQQQRELDALTVESAKRRAAEMSAVQERQIARQRELDSMAARSAEESAAKRSAAVAGQFDKVAKATSLAGLAVAAVSLKMAGDFQSSMTRLVTTAGEAPKMIKPVGDGILEMAGKVGFSAKQLSDAMYIVESSGIHGADALKVLQAAAEGAAQEHADLGKSVDAVTTILHDYHLPAERAADVTSKLITAVSYGKTNLEDFTGSLHSVTPIASAAGISLADVTGSLAAMTASGMSADQAAQNLGAAITYLAKGSTGPARNELAALGISAQDLTNNLGKTGISGALQQISEAIMRHMGPEGQVLIDTFAKSKTAAADAATMFNALPPAAQKVAKAVEDGTMSFKQFRVQGGGLSVDMKKLVDQWLATHTTAEAFNTVLRQGGPAVQNYAGALAKATGTQDGMRTALMLTGENAKYANDAIKDIAGSTSQADGNIKGWSEVQSNFNQKLNEFKGTLGAAAIEIGTHLLPVAGAALDVLSKHKTVVEGVAISFGVVTGAITTYVVATKVASGATAAWTVVTGLASAASDSWIAQQVASGAASVVAAGKTAAFSLAMSENAVASKIGVAGVVLFSGATGAAGVAATVAATSIGLMQAALAGGVVFGVAAVAVSALRANFEKTQPSVEAFTKSLLDAGESGSTKAFGKNLDDLGASIKLLVHPDAVTQMTNFETKFLHIGDTLDVTNAKNQLTGIDKALTGLVQSGAVDKAADGFHQLSLKAAEQGITVGDLMKTLPGYREALLHVDTATRTAADGAAMLKDKQDQEKKSADDMQAANDRVKKTNDDLKSAQDKLNSALQSSIDKFTILNTGALTTERANESLREKTDALAKSVKEHGKSLDITTQSGRDNRTSLLDLIEASNNKITADFKNTEATHGVGKAMDAASAQIATNRQHLIDVATQSGLTKGEAQKLIDTILLTPAQVKTQFNTPELENSTTNVGKLHQAIKDLPPNTTITITATTVGIGLQKDGTAGGQTLGPAFHADGGYISGPGGPRDDVIPAMLSNGEFVVNARATAHHIGLLHEINRYADGGLVQTNNNSITNIGTMMNSGAEVPQKVTASFGINPSTAALYDDITGRLNAIARAFAEAQRAALAAQQAAAAVGGKYNGALPPGPAVERWRSLVDSTLGELGLSQGLDNKVLRQIQTESGGNPNATQGNIGDINNKTGDLARGLMQVIGSTFRAYAGPYVGLGQYDPHASIYAGLNYASHRYGPNLNGLGEGHGYEKGTSYVPVTGPAILHEGEAILTKADNEIRRRAAPLVGTMHVHDAVGLELVLRQAQFRETAGHFG
ncbi:MAG: hypothetical protein NVS3B26_16610 [Mycobacteriales bacterium]